MQKAYITDRQPDIKIDTIKLVKCSNIIAKNPFIMERQLDIKIDTNKVLQCSNIIAKGLYVYRETNRYLDRYN